MNDLVKGFVKMENTPSNFEFLKEHDPLFFQLARRAEEYFVQDPNASLIKLRQFGEALTRDMASQISMVRHDREDQAPFFNRVANRLDLDRTLTSLFHEIRKDGNKATHEFHTEHKQAINALRSAREIAVWYHRSFGKQGERFKPGPFITPTDPSENLTKLQEEIEKLKGSLQDANQSIEKNEQLAQLKKREAEEHAVLKSQMTAVKKEMEELFFQQEQELEDKQKEFEAKSAATAKEIEKLKKENEQLKQVKSNTRKASAKLELSEAETRILIDSQLREAGWQVDSDMLTFSKGARPEKGMNKAIAEWPTNSGPADYVLFVGLIPVAAVEAKKKNRNVSAVIPQAERYARDFKVRPEYEMAWQAEGRTIAWPHGESEHYHLPFVYSCNGRPYIKQFADVSGIWFRDVRAHSNLRQAKPEFHSPEGLLDKLTRSKQEAEEKLKHEPFGYLKLRDYQIKAVQAVEKALEEGAPNALLAMATGTGKTRTILGLMYRFLKAERFKRILFLVDRTSLGDQAFETFQEAKLEQNQSISQIYNVNELGDMQAEAETRVHVATVQSMVNRLFMSDNKPTIDTYDCIIVDEAHRGYTLDQEMGEGESMVRDSAQFLSSYRRVIDYFDAFKVALTATPAAHTTEVFGHPIYKYSYREAVADDWLIDHEPPHQYTTELNQNGVHFNKGDKVTFVNTSGEEALDTAELEDELDFDVESFNRTVITPAFDKVIAEAFAKEFDLDGEAKALIFCMNLAHADSFKIVLDNAFKDLHGNQYKQEAVMVITGKTDKVKSAIKQYKNEPNPKIAITVDLLTTGIDVPEITHIVFMRRVKSRILYEQMKGRATRRCDRIGKTVFHIHDPVALYETLQDVDTMKPLVKDPKISLEQLIDELQTDSSFEVAGSHEGTSHAHDVLDQLSQKVMRVLRKANKEAEDKPAVREKLAELHELWGIEPEKLHHHLHEIGPQSAREFLQQHTNLIEKLDEVKVLIGSSDLPILYKGGDKLIGITQGYGISEKPPGDYIDDFTNFIRQQLNQSAALKVVCSRPKELTREQLKEIKLLLDQNGYSEVKLKSAWRRQTNEEIAASILGYIRQAALGEPLVDFSERVERAMKSIYKAQPWTNLQRKWLDRLAKQLVHEVVVDKHFINERFADDGGVNRFNKILDEQLDTVIEELKEHLWEAV